MDQVQTKIKKQPSLREKEKQLDKAVSLLDKKTDIGFRETLRVIGRTGSFIRYFKTQVATKFVFAAISILLPLLLFPWFPKMMNNNTCRSKLRINVR